MRAVPRSFLLIAATIAAAHAQWQNPPSPGTPRTKDGKPDLFAKPPRLAGKPDLSGVWQVQAPPKAEVERMIGGALSVGLVPGDDITTFSRYFFNILADFKPEDSLLTPAAAEIMRTRSRDPTQTPDARCLPLGVPRAELIGFPWKLVQTPALIVIMHEGDNTHRQIYTDGRKLPTDPNPAWLGYSVGRWEGDTLVVDSTGFTEMVSIDAVGHPISDALRIEERFHRRDFGHMDLQVTITDPKMYTRPVAFQVTQLLLPDGDIFEYFCNENEKDRTHLK